MTFNFDEIFPRTGSGALKFDDCISIFGRENIQPMWVADMDFAAPPAVVAVLQARAAHPVYGYTKTPESLYQTLINWLCNKAPLANQPRPHPALPRRSAIAQRHSYGTHPAGRACHRPATGIAGGTCWKAR